MLAFTFSLAFSDKSYADFLSQECAFFNIFVVDLYQAMLANPNKPIDLLFCTVPQKYFALVLFFFSAIVLPYDYISIATVLIIGTALHLTRNINLLNPVIGTIERTVGCGRACDCSSIGYITAEQGAVNAVQCTDTYVPFNRRQIKGRVATNQAYKQRVSQFEADRSLFVNPGGRSSSSSGTTIASSGVSLGGGSALGGATNNRAQSKLL